MSFFVTFEEEDGLELLIHGPCVALRLMPSACVSAHTAACTGIVRKGAPDTVKVLSDPSILQPTTLTFFTPNPTYFDPENTRSMEICLSTGHPKVSPRVGSVAGYPYLHPEDLTRRLREAWHAEFTLLDLARCVLTLFALDREDP